MKNSEWDVFISHAWEDKESFARPLAQALENVGLRVWYDEFTLSIGDGLRRSIDRGLANSRYGIVILSPNFFEKEWPQKELDGLAARETNGEKVILPVWHNLTANQVRQYSPMLADRIGVSSNLGLPNVVDELLRAIRWQVPLQSSERPARLQSQRGRLLLLALSGITIILALIGFVGNRLTSPSSNLPSTPSVSLVAQIDTTAALATPSSMTTVSVIATPPTPTTVLPSLLPTPTPTRTRTATPRPLTPTAVVPKPASTPQPTATLVFRIITLRDTLLLFSNLGGFPNPSASGGYLDRNRQTLISEGELNQQSGARKVKIKLGVFPGDYSNGTISYAGSGPGFPFPLYSALDSTSDPIGQSKIVWQVELNGTNDRRFEVIVECWVEERVLRMP